MRESRKSGFCEGRTTVRGASTRHLTRSLNPKAEGEIVIVRLGGETHDEKGLLDLLYGLFSGNQKKVLSYIPDADNQICQKGGLIC